MEKERRAERSGRAERRAEKEGTKGAAAVAEEEEGRAERRGSKGDGKGRESRRAREGRRERERAEERAARETRAEERARKDEEVGGRAREAQAKPPRQHPSSTQKTQQRCCKPQDVGGDMEGETKEATEGEKSKQRPQRAKSRVSHSEGQFRPRTHRSGGARGVEAPSCLGGGGEAHPQRGAERPRGERSMEGAEGVERKERRERSRCG